MRILFLSNATFHAPGVRTGLQFIAQHLARLGHEVEYVGLLINPFDSIAGNRRERWCRTWAQSWTRSENCIIPVERHLHEIVLRSPFPRGRRFWLLDGMLRLYPELAAPYFESKRYDVCIFDSSFSALCVPHVKARHLVYRVNDNPEGFSSHMDDSVIDWFRRIVASGRVSEFWPVSQNLESWVRGLRPDAVVDLAPNGVELEKFRAALTTHRKEKAAVYVGKVNPWFDVRLLARTAKRLPDWEFHIYGPDPSNRLSRLRGPNLFRHGPIAYAEVPALLSQFPVGLIPFSGDSAFLDAFDPLKLVQYLAAGCGVASTPVGHLTETWKNDVSFGSGSGPFAAAIRKAADKAANRSSKPNSTKRLDRILAEKDWGHLVNRLESRLCRLSNH